MAWVDLTHERIGPMDVHDPGGVTFEHGAAGDLVELDTQVVADQAPPQASPDAYVSQQHTVGQAAGYLAMAS